MTPLVSRVMLYQPMSTADLSQRIRELQEEFGLTEREFARFCLLKSESHINNLLKGQRATVSTLTKIAVATKVNFTWLSTGVGPKRSESQPGEDGFHPALTEAVRFARLNNVPEPVVGEYIRIHKSDNFRGSLSGEIYLEIVALAQMRRRGFSGGHRPENTRPGEVLPFKSKRAETESADPLRFTTNEQRVKHFKDHTTPQLAPPSHPSTGSGDDEK